MTQDPHFAAPVAVPQPPASPAMPPPPPALAVNMGGIGVEHIGGKPVASIGKRIGAWLLDSVIMFVTLGIGWLVWAAMLADGGQTPGKKLLNLRVRRLDNGVPASFANMLFMRGLLGGVAASIAYSISFGVLMLMPLWDKRNQTVVDKVSGTVVVDEA